MFVWLMPFRFNRVPGGISIACLNLLVLGGASGGGSGGFEGYFLRDHMSILDKELGTGFDHGVVLDICLDKELDTVLDMDQDKDLYIVLGMGLCRELYRDLYMGLHKDLGNEPPRYPIHIHMFGCFHVHTYVHIERDKSEMLPVLFMLLPLPPLLMMRLLPPGFDLDMLRDIDMNLKFVDLPLPLLMMIGKESDLRSPPLLALMLLSRMPMMVLVSAVI